MLVGGKEHHIPRSFKHIFWSELAEGCVRIRTDCLRNIASRTSLLSLFLYSFFISKSLPIIMVFLHDKTYSLSRKKHYIPRSFKHDMFWSETTKGSVRITTDCLRNITSRTSLISLFLYFFFVSKSLPLSFDNDVIC